MTANPKPDGFYFYNGVAYPRYTTRPNARIPAPQVEMWLDEPQKKRGIFRRIRRKKK